MSPVRYQSEKCDVSRLDRPLKFAFSGKTAKNRFLKAAMTERLSSWDPENFKARGVPSQNLVNVYKRWGEGGFGQILTGNIMIDYDQLEAMGNMIIPRESIFSGARFEAFKELAAAGKALGSLVVGQVCHPGRQVGDIIQADPISASDIQLEINMMGMNFAKPHPASQGEIDHVIDGFAHAAEFLDKAGYDGIQLHAAHGYLLSQFLSRVTNKRTDQYGGCLENRLRIIVEIAQECRKRVSEDFILAIKINSVEFQEDGITPEEAQGLCKTLEQTRFDYVELSGGTYETQAFIHKRESTKKRESFFLEFAEEIVKPLSRTKTYITGGFKTAGAMVNALETVDGVGLARVAAQEFHLPRDILDGNVTGAIQSRLDENNYGLTNVAAGTQIQQVSKDEMPFDLSDDKSLQAFMGDMYAWGKKLGADGEHKLSGYVDLTSPSTSFV